MRFCLLLISVSLCNIALAKGEQSIDDAPLDVETILANPLDADAYTERRLCLSTAQYQHIEIVSDQALLFHGRGRRAWLNQISNRCTGLREGMIVTIVLHSTRACEMDRFQGVVRGAYAMSTPPCRLGPFEPIAEEQIEFLRDALRAKAQTSTVSATQRKAELEP